MSLTIEQLPARIRNYLASHFTATKNLRLATRYKIPKKKNTDFARLVGQAFLKEYKLDDLPTKLKQEIGLKTPAAFLLASEVAEQHFVSHLDFFGAVEPFVDQWHEWGSQLGGKVPSELPTVSPRAFKAVPTDIRPAKVKPTKQKVDLARTRKSAAVTVPRPLRQRPVQPVAARQTSEATQQPGRKNFLNKIQKFSIDDLRPAGQSAGNRIKQVDQNLQNVLQKTPQDRADVAQAFKQSQLFTLYQSQGQEVARSGQNLDQVIYARYEGGQPYLLKEEFNAVANILKLIQ